MKLNLRKFRDLLSFGYPANTASVLCIMMLITAPVSAQLNPTISSYFQNQYLNNPAFAGIQKGLNVSAGYNREWVNSDGAPVLNLIAADYRTGNMGFGLYINTIQDGAFNNNRYGASYAYHLMFDKGSQLSFGLSAGITTDKLNTSEFFGDADDPAVMAYNNRETDFDADFGASFKTNGFVFQGVLQNMKQYFNEYAEVALYPSAAYLTAVSYKFNWAMVSFEPKAVYRGFWNHSNILDVGVNATFDGEKFNALAMFHSTKNATVGFGFTHQKRYQLQLGYTSPAISSAKTHTNGIIEVGIKASFFN